MNRVALSRPRCSITDRRHIVCGEKRNRGPADWSLACEQSAMLLEMLTSAVRGKCPLANRMALWEYGKVKTTVESPDELFREAKATAARNGTKLKDLVADGLRLVLTQSKPEKSRLQFPLIPRRKGSPRLTAARVNEIIETEDREQDANDASPRRR